MFTRKRIGFGLAGLVLAAAALAPALASASASGDAEPAGPAIAGQQSDDGETPQFRHHGFRGRHHGGVLRGVLDGFGIEPEQARDAAESVREQFPLDERPRFDRPLTDDQKAELRAYHEQRTAAFADALGIDAGEFAAAIQSARDARMERVTERRAEWRSALADELGITVEALQEAQERARDTLRQAAQ